MTRFSDDNDYVDPRSLAAQNTQNDGYSINSNSTYAASNQQSQFADYIMPVGANATSNRNYVDSGYVDPRYASASSLDSSYDSNYVDPRYTDNRYTSVRNDQMARSMALPFSTGLQNGAAYGWQNNQGESYRERQIEHRREQRLQSELYYDATTPRFNTYQDPGYSTYNGGNFDNYNRGQVERVYVAPQPHRYDDRNLQVRTDDYAHDRQPVRRASSGSPDLTENSFENGSQYPQGRSNSDATGSSDNTQTFTQDGGKGNGNWTKYDWAVYNHLNEQAQALVGHNIQEFDKSVPIRLGCARAVSLLVEKGYGFPIKDQAIVNVEKDLRKMGFTQVSANDMKPGDVICGYREAGDYPHGAVYMGNGKIFNNDSDAGTMEIQSIAKYNRSEFKKFVILRRPDTVPAVAAGSNSDRGRAGVASTSGQGNDQINDQDAG